MRFALLLLVPLIAIAADKKVKKYTMDDFVWSKVVSGPALTELTLKDKGVIICLFSHEADKNPGVHLQNFRHVVEATHGKVFPIAIEPSNFANRELHELLNQLKAFDFNYTVATGLKKCPPTEPFVPFCFVLNSKKVMIFSGSMGAAGFKEAMEQASNPAFNASDKPKDTKKEESPKALPADPKKAA